MSDGPRGRRDRRDERDRSAGNRRTDRRDCGLKTRPRPAEDLGPSRASSNRRAARAERTGPSSPWTVLTRHGGLRREATRSRPPSPSGVSRIGHHESETWICRCRDIRCGSPSEQRKAARASTTLASRLEETATQGLLDYAPSATRGRCLLWNPMANRAPPRVRDKVARRIRGRCGFWATLTPRSKDPSGMMG